MSEIDLLLWVWLIAGAVSVLIHAKDMPDNVSFKAILLLVVAWPAWLVHYSWGPRNGERRKDELALVRIDVDIQRERRKR